MMAGYEQTRLIVTDKISFHALTTLGRPGDWNDLKVKGCYLINKTWVQWQSHLVTHYHREWGSTAEDRFCSDIILQVCSNTLLLRVITQILFLIFMSPYFTLYDPNLVTAEFSPWTSTVIAMIRSATLGGNCHGVNNRPIRIKVHHSCLLFSGALQEEIQAQK